MKRDYHGKQPALSEEDVFALKQILREGKFKTAKEIQQWLKKERGVSFSLSGVYYWLKKLTGRHKVPRKVSDKQDPAQKEAFVKDITATLNTLEIPKDKPVCIWEGFLSFGMIKACGRRTSLWPD